MKKLTFFLLFLAAMAPGFAANRYWVGGATGDWDATTSWSNISSAGASGATAPTTTDDVYFENGAATVTLTAGITVNSITFTSSNVTLSGAFGVTVNSALTFAGTAPGITYTTGTSGKAFTLGNGNAFTLTGNSTTNQIKGNLNAYFTFNTSSSLTVYLYSTTTSGVGQIKVVKGLITVGNSLVTSRLHLGELNREELIVGENTTLTLNGNFGSYFTGTTNGGVIDASATGSKFNVKATNAGFLSTTGRIFKNATTINNLQMNSSGKTFVLGFPLTVNTLTLSAGTINNTDNNITIASGGNVITTNGTTSVPVLNPPAPTVTPTIGTYTYNGSPQGPNEATNTGTGSSYTFSYAGTGTTTYGPSATLPTNAGNYTVTATVAADGNYVEGVSAATAFDILSTETANTGGNLSDIALTLTDPELANTNITVSSGELVIDATKTVRSITVNGGAKLTVPTGQTLTLTNLTLKSNATNTATYKPEGNGALVVTGTTAVEQYLTYTRNYYVSSPVSNAVAPAGYTYFGRHEPGGTETGWATVIVGAGLTAGKGYIALPGTADAPITFTTQNGGTLNTGNITIPLTYTPEATSGNGYNLIGNPYPSHLSWNQTFTDANVAKIEPSIWYRSKVGNGNSGGWSFKTYNALLNEGSPLGTTGVIPPMQGFWVLAKQTTTIEFTDDMRSHETGNPLKIKAVQNTDRKKLRVQVSKGTRTDEALIIYDAIASDGYDAYDSPKIMNNVSDLADIYTVTDAKKLVINGLNSVKYDTEIPLGFSSITAGDFSISANEISNFAAGTRVYLIDKLNHATEFELTNGMAYSFNAPVTTASTDRFSLLFRAPGITTGAVNPEKESVSVFVNSQNQLVINANAGSKYAVYNAVGQLIDNGILNSKFVIPNLKLNTGVYVVKVGNVTERVIIK